MGDDVFSEDIKANIEMEEKEILEQRNRVLHGKKPDVLTMLASWSFNRRSVYQMESMSKKLNDLLFEEIIATNDCSCQQCEQRVCSHKNARNCAVNKGDNTRIKKAKNGFWRKWENVLQQLQPNMPDQNFQKIEKFVMDGVKEGIYLKMQKEIQGILSNMRGRNSENNLTGVYEVLLHNRRGILFNGFKMRENLKPFFDAFNINLPQYQSNEREEVEHDLFHIAPQKDEVGVSFVQAKSQLNVPWTGAKKENIVKLIETACSQLVADIEAFSELSTHFLTDEQFKIIKFNANVSLSDLSKLDGRQLCDTCRDSFVYDEDKGKDGGAKYTFHQLRTLFGQPPHKERATP